MTIIGLVFAISSLVNATTAENLACWDIDNETSVMGTPRSFLDQNGDDSLGWCSANLAADVASQSLGVRISAVDLGLIYSAESAAKRTSVNSFISGTSEQLFRGGWPQEVLSLAQVGEGFCLETEIKDSNYNLGPKKASTIEILQNISRFSQKCNPAQLASHNNACDSLRSNLEAMFPSADREKMIAIMMEDSKVSRWSTLVKFACDGKRVKLDAGYSVKAVLVDFENRDRSQIMDPIDNALNEYKIAGIMYDANRVPQANILRSISAGLNELVSGEMTHAASIVERKWDQTNRKCMYRIRGTTGSECFGAGFCSQGYAWLSRKEVEYATYGVVYLSKSKSDSLP